MRKIVLILFFILFICNYLFAQDKSEKNLNTSDITRLIPIEKISDDNNMVLIISELISYGDAFVYYKEFNEGKYKIEKNANGFVIRIIINKNAHEKKRIEFDSIEIKKVFGNSKGSNEYRLEMKNIEKYFDKSKIGEKFRNSNSGFSSWNIFYKDNMLIDKDILANAVPNGPTRIFNKERSNTFLYVPYSYERSDTYSEATDGAIVPSENGNNSKIYTVDRNWNRIIYTDKEFQYSSNFIKTFGNYGANIGQFYSPTGITYGANDASVFRQIYVADCGNNRIQKLRYRTDYGLQAVNIFRADLSNPYDIAFSTGQNIYNTDDDQLWFSERGPKFDIKWVWASTGTDIRTINMFQYNNQNYRLFPGRLDVWDEYIWSVYTKGILAYVDLALNAVIFIRRYNYYNGLPEPMIPFYAVQFNNTEKVTSVKFATGVPGSINPVMVLITTNDQNGNGHLHVGKVNFSLVPGCSQCGFNEPVNVEYLASTSTLVKNNNSLPFKDLLNIESQIGYEDIFTYEKWNNYGGLRRMKFGVCVLNNNWGDIYSVSSGINWNVRMTGPVKAEIYTQYTTNNGVNWVSVAGLVNRISISELNPITLMTGTNYINFWLPLPPIDFIPDNNRVKIRVVLYPLNEGNSSSYMQEIIIEKSIITNPNGGCPYLYALIDSNYNADNNILHRSEFEQNVGNDITDKYRLNLYPSINSNDTTISLKFVEKNDDHSFFDEVKLYAVDHPIDTKVGITENNDVVLYSPALLTSPDEAELNGEDVTEELQYNSNDTSNVDGNPNDLLNASFGDSRDYLSKYKQFKSKLIKYLSLFQKVFFHKDFNLKNGIIADSIAVVLDARGNYIYNSSKTDAGVITGYASDGSFTSETKSFARRENLSDVIVPLSGSDVVLDSASIVWNRDYSVSYISTTPIFYGGYIENEIPLIEAHHTNQGNVLDYLQTQDGLYAEMDNTSEILLKFKCNLPELQVGLTRDYYLVVTGRYDTQGDKVIKTNKVVNNNSNELPKTYELSQNYPNPFNPNTTIKFALPKDGFVSIKIYDIAGREIVKLVSEDKKAGYYFVQFNGSQFASGVYFYRIQSGSFIQTKKMVLIK